MTEESARDQIERGAWLTNSGTPTDGEVALSVAISLRRIADNLDGLDDMVEATQHIAGCMGDLEVIGDVIGKTGTGRGYLRFADVG